MINKLDRDRLSDMLHFAKVAVRNASKEHPEGTEEFEDTYLALCRAIELIGEAAAKVSDVTKATMPDLDWREMIGMRHRLIHGYASLSAEIVFDTARHDLPPLIDTLRRALEKTAP